MGKKIDLTGQTFGYLIVLNETDERRNKSVVWNCRCSCGKIVKYSTKQLISDGIQSCKECNLKRQPQQNLLLDIVGKKFNHWTVLEKTSERSLDKILYKCQCDCLEKTISYHTRTELVNGESKSCGCANRRYKIGDQVGNFKIIEYTHNRQSPYLAECLRCGSIKSYTGHRLRHQMSCGCLHISRGELEIFNLLTSYNIPFKREYQFKNSKFRYDFAVFNNKDQLIQLIEFDGEAHYKENIKNSGWNTVEHYEETRRRDKEKDKLAQEMGIPLIRIPYTQRGKITIKDIIKEGVYLDYE